MLRSASGITYKMIYDLRKNITLGK
jgi:hypothetical protein